MIFGQLLVGVDGSREGLIALRQALRLRAPAAPLVAVTVCNSAVAAQAGYEAPRAASQLRAEAQAALAATDVVIGDHKQATALVVEGRPVPALRELVHRYQSTLLVLGSHGGSRVSGMLLGSVATELLNDAPCAILLARAPSDDDAAFPRRIVLGLDGSSHSAVAASAADELARRLDIEVVPVAAQGGKWIERVAVQAIVDGLAATVAPVKFDACAPVKALVTAAKDGDLIMVGSRGLHGLRALGSVSERVAHQAPCSVLVIPPPSTR